MNASEVTINEVASLEALAPLWPHPAGGSPADCLFLRYEWFDAAWQWAGTGARPWFLAAQRDGRTIGILPLILRAERFRRIPVRRLEFLSVPDTQLCDVICAADGKAPILQAFAAHLARRRADWDLLRLEKIPEASNTPELLRDALATLGIRSEIAADHPNQAIDVCGDWQRYYGRRSRRLKKGNNLIANKLKKQAQQIDIRWLTGAELDPHTVATAIAEAVAISSQSWKRDTRLTLDNPGPHAFLQTITRHAVRHGWLSLWTLVCDDRAVAFEYQLRYGSDIYALRADYDQAAEALSPGSYLNWKLLERLFDGEPGRYHLGQGENPYKSRWAEVAEPHRCLTAFSGGLRGRGLALLELFLVPRLRRVLRPARGPLSAPK